MAFTFLIGLLFFFNAAQAAGPSTVAIVIVDMQDSFLDGYLAPSKGRLNRKKKLIDAQVRLLDWGLKNDFPILVLEYANMGPTTERLKNSLARFNQDRIRVLSKDLNDAFKTDPETSEDANSILSEWGVTQLVISGINGPLCVLQTTLGAMANGFDVFSAPNLVGNFDFYSVWPDREWSTNLAHCYQELKMQKLVQYTDFPGKYFEFAHSRSITSKKPLEENSAMSNCQTILADDDAALLGTSQVEATPSKPHEL